MSYSNYHIFFVVDLFILIFLIKISENSKVPQCAVGDTNCIKEVSNLVLSQFYLGKYNRVVVVVVVDS